jgi:uncharacterized membrane protein YdbT with pleckstrin-like domain
MKYLNKLLGHDETILFRTHQHFFVIFGEILREVLILVVVGVGFYVVHQWSPKQAIWFYSVLYFVGAVVLVSMLLDILRWRAEEFLITNHRVIQCSGIINKNVLDSSLNKINDVALHHNWLGRMLGYGTLEILTASEEVVNRIEKISHPIEFKRAMLDAKAKSEAVPKAELASRSATELLEELVQLKAKNMLSDSEYEEKRKEILKRM